MSRFRWFPLFASLTVLTVGSMPVWAQHHGGGGRGGAWPPQMARIEPPSPQVPGLPGGREPRNGMPSMDAGLRSRPVAGDCSHSMALSPGDQVLSVQPMDFGGRVQCRIKVMGADGMVRVMMVSPGL